MSRKIRRVAVIIETTRAYGRRIMDGIADYLHENKPWQIFVEPRGLHDTLPEWIHSWKGDGIIARISDSEILEQFRKNGIPFVNLKGNFPEMEKDSLLSTDRRAVGRMAAEHLMERNFRHFAFVGVAGSSWSDLEMLGFSEALHENGFTFQDFQYKSELGSCKHDGVMVEEIDAIANWLPTLPLPVGILAADDYIGVQLLSACYQANVKVPDMAAVVGVGDEENICRLTSPTLSSVRPNEILLGRKAAALLDAMMDGESLEHFQPEQIPPLYVSLRLSSKVMAVDDEVVMRALGFIRENIKETINVYDVLNAVGVSRTLLQKRFHAILGQSVYGTILDMKLKVVKELLRNTNMTMRQIARQTGFKHVEHLNNLFKQKVGIPLAAYRKKREE